jgi:hypothetical protein
MKGEPKPMVEKQYVGIDVAKDSMNVAVHLSQQQWSFPNDPRGIDEAVSRLRELGAHLPLLFWKPLAASRCPLQVPWQRLVCQWR